MKMGNVDNDTTKVKDVVILEKTIPEYRNIPIKWPCIHMTQYFRFYDKN